MSAALGKGSSENKLGFVVRCLLLVMLWGKPREEQLLCETSMSEY